MPQGKYDARESGNYKIVNGRRVPLPPRSSNDTRASGERGPKGSPTYTRQDPTRGGMVDTHGVPFSMDPQGRPITSIARDVAGQRSTANNLISQIPNVSRPRAIDAWYGDVTTHDPVHPTPTSRPWGKEGTAAHPDYRAQTVRQGAKEAADQATKLRGQARKAGMTPRTNADLATEIFNYGRVGQRLRDDATRYEKEYADKYLAHQTDRMRGMINARKPPAPSVAPSDAHRGGNSNAKPPHYAGYHPADNLPAHAYMKEYYDTIKDTGKALAGKVIPAKGSTARKVAGGAGLAAAAFVAGRATEHGEKVAPQRTESQKMRDDASDMGPVKGRVMERRTYQAASGTRPQATKIVPYEGQGPLSKKLGVSNVKAGNNK